MDNLKIGQVIESAQHRDAIHIAVAPVVASERLAPGQHVGLIGEIARPSESPIGIVDPFLKGPVFKGDRFWLFLYPGSITSLRHDWTHPSFATETVTDISASARAASEQWLRDFCATADCPGYEAVMKAIEADDHNDPEGYLYTKLSGEYLFFGGSDAHGEIPPEFWDHVKNVIGKEPRARARYFSCWWGSTYGP